MSERERAIFEQCVRGARRNIAFVLNTYRYMIKGLDCDVSTLNPYEARVKGSDAIFSYLCAPRLTNTLESTLLACERDGVDVMHAVSRVMDVYAQTIDSAAAFHTTLSDADSCYRFKSTAIERLCLNTRSALMENGSPLTREVFDSILKEHRVTKKLSI